MKKAPRPSFLLQAPTGTIWLCEPDKEPIGTPAAKRSLIARIATAIKTALL